jgi:hypothetical protein
LLQTATAKFSDFGRSVGLTCTMDQAKRRPTRLVDHGNLAHFKREDAFGQPDFHDEILKSVPRGNPEGIALCASDDGVDRELPNLLRRL